MLRCPVTWRAHTAHVINTAHSFLSSPKCRTNKHNLMNIKENIFFHHYKNINVSLYKNTDNIT
ncbi:hypothetical protein D4Z79_26240 [Escherichia coli]|nr:hypothetical protein [Escherichia coli]EEX0224217.1 hypothetical protein [Escherichia coli]EFN7556486.1 hypothetical protein [Escherichia coli]EGE4452328.1 hypothetical protein [Escherichia coli]